MGLSKDQRKELLSLVKARFETHLKRHPKIEWASVQAKLEANPSALHALYEMERTGGEPDVVGYDAATGEYLIYDCSPESPQGRRSLCYDDDALEARKANKPTGSAVGAAAAMGIVLLTEGEYRALQRLGEFDTKTSSWVKTPVAIRERGGAIFADYRYGAVFIYHNGADSYYAARGFRGVLRV
ncbi:MAG TPA: DUF4256 domain-containing protein [Aggregatilineales bacterium]|nr:DUF4256 domain-containing protein [Anaerolineales bacterium]HRE47918.1 DUF4256 domain-containing protein [Aggregatilineales bacterium]